MKATIAGIGREWDPALCKYYWVINLECNDEPDLKMGDCEVKQ